MKPSKLFGALLGALLFDAVGHAAVLIDTVPIGNPGNAADTRYVPSQYPNPIGAVAYPYHMGKTEVTNGQYVEFLNAVAASDPYGLYSTGMGNASIGGIVRSGSSGSYAYAIKAPALSGAYAYGGKPVVFVSSGDAMRFANWLHRGQPSGAQDASTTEDGAYTLNGAMSSVALAAVARNGGARWFLPTVDEWYKAAYHKNDGVTGNYWDFPTGTDTWPNNNLPSADTGNSANYTDGDPTIGNSSYPMTNAGAYALSASPYGTLDQGGNVFEWTETLVTLFSPTAREVRGGAWYSSAELYAGGGAGGGWESGDDYSGIGFRVASIPEPNALCLGTMAVIGIAWRRRRRGKALLPPHAPLKRHTFDREDPCVKNGSPAEDTTFTSGV